MSLLNEMLQDLSNKVTERPVILPVAAFNQHKVKVIQNALFWLMVVGTLFVVTVIVLYWPKHTATEISVQSVMHLSSTLVPIPKMQISSEIEMVSSLTPVPLMPVTVVEPASAIEADALDHKMTDKPTQDAWYDDKLNAALIAIDEGNDPRAIDLLELILTRVPESIDARENLAALYLSHGEMTPAFEILDEGLRLEPHNIRLSTMKARLLVEQGHHQEALAILEQFTPNINKAPDYYALLAAIFESLGRTNEAGSVYQSLIKVDPSDGQYWLGFGIALEHKHSLRQAIEAYKRASQSENVQPAVRSYAENRLKVLQG